MTILELMDAIRDGIEALSATPLSAFEAYVTTPVSKRDIADEAVFIDIAEGGVSETGIGIAGGVGRWNLEVPLEITASFAARDTDTNRDKAFEALEQLQKFVRDNRTVEIGGETAQLATWSNGIVGYTEEGNDDASRILRVAQIQATWRIPQETA